MATRIDNAVTLSHAQAREAQRLLADYAVSLTAHARRTRSVMVREECERQNAHCHALSRYLVEHLWSWTDNA